MKYLSLSFESSTRECFGIKLFVQFEIGESFADLLIDLIENPYRLSSEISIKRFLVDVSRLEHIQLSLLKEFIC